MLSKRRPEITRNAASPTHKTVRKKWRDKMNRIGPRWTRSNKRIGVFDGSEFLDFPNDAFDRTCSMNAAVSVLLGHDRSQTLSFVF